MKDIKGYHIYVYLFFNSSFEKSMMVIPFSPLLLLGSRIHTWRSVARPRNDLGATIKYCEKQRAATRASA
jgi:hypothetical protein